MEFHPYLTSGRSSSERFWVYLAQRNHLCIYERENAGRSSNFITCVDEVHSRFTKLCSSLIAIELLLDWLNHCTTGSVGDELDAHILAVLLSLIFCCMRN